MLVVQIILLITAAYLVCGLTVGIALVSRGISAVDPAARGAAWSFRVLILPGVAALWPLIATRWLRSRH